MGIRQVVASPRRWPKRCPRSSSSAKKKGSAKTARVTSPKDPSQEARRTAAAILEVLAGMRTPSEAAQALSVSVPRYYALEQRAVASLVLWCFNVWYHPGGRSWKIDFARRVSWKSVIG